MKRIIKFIFLTIFLYLNIQIAISDKTIYDDNIATATEMEIEENNLDKIEDFKRNKEIGFYNEDNFEEQGCKILESCRKCTNLEQENEIYCKETNYKIKLSCINDEIQYRPCNINEKLYNYDKEARISNTNNIEKSPALNIVYFEVVVLVVFVFSIYFVKERKRISMQQNNERLAKQLNKV